MATQRYSITPHPIRTLLSWVESGEIAIPEIQRPFVWNTTKVRNLLDSLYQGYPVGYLIAWRNPDVRLKDGSTSVGKRILIDGQQRVTALRAALLGEEVVTKDYNTVRIRIAFHPIKEKFEVRNSAIARDVAWIEDVSAIIASNTSVTALTEAYTRKNIGAEPNKISLILEKVRMITNNSVGLIELNEDINIETVTEIFIRVNSTGKALSQADFVMSKIATNERFGGHILRKAIDYFCYLAVAPDSYSDIEKNDPEFARSEFLPKMRWLKNVNDDLYDPTYTDMLRVAFTSEFHRGKLQDLVALLSGRNFETRKYEDTIAEESFARLKNGVLAFINKTNFDRFVMILRSSGFLNNSLIRRSNAINFAYILYLHGRNKNLPAADIERIVRRWYIMSVLTGRYAGSPETTFDNDIRQVDAQGVQAYIEAIIESELPPTFWTDTLPLDMNTSSGQSPYFVAYQAAQVRLGDRGFLSTDITVRDMLLNRGDKHHVFPRNYLQKQSISRTRHNQIANFVIAQSEINIAIGNKAPEKYFAELLQQCNGGKKHYGGITNKNELRENLAANCIPMGMLNDNPPDYETFLVERRKLMALKIKQWFEEL